MTKAMCKKNKDNHLINVLIIIEWNVYSITIRKKYVVQTYTILVLRRAEAVRLGELKASLSYIRRLSHK